MKRFINKFSILLVGFVLLAQGCTKDFTEINTDPTSAGAEAFNPNSLLTSAQLRYTGSTDFAFETWRTNLIYFSVMMQHLANVNGYWVGDKSRNNPGYEASYFERAYDEQVKYAVDLVRFTEGKPEYPNLHNVGRIMKVLVFHRLTDIYGEVPYSEAGLGFYEQIFTPKYDTQESIYDHMLSELESAAANLNPNEDALSGDLIYAGDLDKWKKLANSLMLRLAMRLSKRNAAKAQQWAEKAAAAGVMTSNDDNALIRHDASSDRLTPCRNSIVMNLPYESPNMRLSQTFVNWMKSKSDPRLFVYGKNPDGTTNPATTFGMPNGYDLTNKPVSGAPGYPANGLDGYIAPNLAVIGKMNGPTFILTYAEVELLLAEAAQRGWNAGGSASDHYNKGVKAALTYLSQYDPAGAIDAAVADAYVGANALQAGSELQQIAEQYWAATFLNEYEAFANWRRTGFPQLTPTTFPDDITNGQIPRRLRYPTGEYSNNEAHIQEAVARQGADDLLTRVWWDN